MRFVSLGSVVARGTRVPSRAHRVSHAWLGFLASAALLAGVFVLVRLPLALTSTLSETYYDEAVTGLMSLEILRGVPQVFYWGQPYLGAVDAYLAALAFYVFGPSTLALRLGTAWISVVWVWAGWRIGCRVAGENWGLLAGLQLALPPIFLSHLQLSSHAEGVAFSLATVALAAAVSLLEPLSPRAQWLAWVLLGLAGGLAWWTTPMVAMLLGAAVIGLVVARPGVLRGPGPYVALGLFGLGSAPFWLWNVSHEWATFRHLLEWGTPLPGPKIRIQHAGGALVATLGNTYWDARAAPLAPWSSLLGWVLLGTVYLGAVGLAASRLVVWAGRLARRTRPWQEPLDLVALVFWFTVAAQLLTWFGTSGVIRYSLTFFASLPFLVAAVLAPLAGVGRWGQGVAVTLAITLLVFNLATHAGFVQASARVPVRPIDTVIARLRALGVTACYADSRISQVLTFESAERIRCADYLGYRSFGLLRAVDALEDPASVAIVTNRALKNPEPPVMAQGLRLLGAAFQQDGIGEYEIFHHFVAPSPLLQRVPATHWRARASSGVDGAHLAFDRRAWTRWTAPKRPGEWFELDLGQAVPLAQTSFLAAPWTAESPGGIRIETSMDGDQWATVATGQNLVPGLHWWKGHPRLDDSGRLIVRFPPRPSRYVRFTYDGPEWPGGRWSVAELFVYALASAPWSPPPAATAALASGIRGLDHWMDDPTGPHPSRAPATAAHRRAQVPWGATFGAINEALAAAPDWEEAHHLYGLALARTGWGAGPDRTLEQARSDGAWLEVIRLAELIDAAPDPEWRAGRLEAWALALERLGRTTEAAAVRARPAPAPARSVRVRFGPDLELTGIDGPPEARPGETVRVGYHWHLLGASAHDYWVFLHVPGLPGGPNYDKPVGGGYGVSRWATGERVRQIVTLAIPADTPPGTYPMRLGVWFPSTGRRLRILASELPQARRAVTIGTVVVAR